MVEMRATATFSILYLIAPDYLMVIALRLNNDNLVEARAIWIEFGWHPPSNQ